ncbi:diphthine synthase [Candidatus Woesearchaeota archaeon]|nr:MAG: diphthine synthase [Candidatus Woesearchaeota archaeon]
MALYLIGIGLNDEQDISLKGLEAVRKCDSVYLENYTSLLQCPVERLEKLYGKKIILADRELVEKKAEETILKGAKDKDVALLIIGDVFSATTHTDIFLRAKKLDIPVNVIHNASVLTAVGETGLELYKFGKTTSIPFKEKGFEPETYYDVLLENQHLGLHTLFLLDLRPAEKKFMTIKEAIQNLLDIEDKRKEKILTEKTLCVGCARLGNKNQKIIYGSAEELMKLDFGKAPHCLIVPGKLHFMEEEILKRVWGFKGAVHL